MSKKKDKGKIANNSWLNFLDTLTSIVIIPVLVFSIICSVIMINAKRSNNMPNIFGYSLVTILSESMTNSGFMIDDTVMVKNTDPGELQVGDVIAYYKYVETTNIDLSNVARAEDDDNVTEAFNETNLPTHSKVSSWKLYLSKLFSNITYTSTEASEKAILSNSPIIFHQVVDIVEYDGYKWFRTWGTSNIDAKGDPIYDSYWIREDYVIGRYTHTGKSIRSFLSFASTNTGILWMVEVPSGVHLILSTLELVEILDMMTKERHERIKNGTYIDRREYKRMLRAKRKMLASGNIDLETFKKMYPSYSNFEIVYSEVENNKQNVNINGPPTSNGIEDKEAMLYGRGTYKVGESPPNGRAPNERDGPPGDEGESPPNGTPRSSGESPPNAVGPPNKESPPNSVGPPSAESPPNAVGPPNKESPPNKALKPNARGDTGDSPPNGTKPTGRSPNSAETQNFDKTKIDKSVYAVSVGGLYDAEDKAQEAKDLKDLQLQAEKYNKKTAKVKLGKNEVHLTDAEIESMIDIYHAGEADFISSVELTGKGVVTKPDKKNKIYLVTKKTKKQFSLSSLGKILSVNSGLITTDNGIYKCIITAKGVEFEKLKVNPKFTIISAKQDIFGNVFVGITGGGTEEITYKTSDGKLVSIWNRNALLTTGENFKLYYMSMDKSFNLEKGIITDLNVMNKEGKLVSVDPKSITKPIRFIDGFDKYGFMFLISNVLVLNKGKLLFTIDTHQTIKLTDNVWLTSDMKLVEHGETSNKLLQFDLEEYVKKFQNGILVDDDSGGGTVLMENIKSVKTTDKSLEVDVGDGKTKSIDLYT